MSGAAVTTQVPCPAIAGTRVIDGTLPRLQSRWADTGPIRIVAIGSSSTGGAGATKPAHSYPSQLEAALRIRFPARDITVINAGVNGNEVRDMLARLDRDVLAHRPDLVIWQFGSNSLMRGSPVETMEAQAREGVARIRASGAELMLMDLQHAGRIDTLPFRDTVLAMMQRIATSTGSAIFHRYALMKAWDDQLGPQYAKVMLDPDQLHMNDTSYRCLAMAVASTLLPGDRAATLATAATPAPAGTPPAAKISPAAAPAPAAKAP